MKRTLSGAGLFSLLFCAQAMLYAQTSPTDKTSLIPIEILRIENPTLSNTTTEARIYWKTGAAVLYQVRKGFNCRDGEPLDKVAYSGVTEANNESVLKIRVMALKAGLNNLVICVNRRPVSAASSNDLDYGSDVYEKGLTLHVDRTPPVILAIHDRSESTPGQIVASCYDDSGCESISYELLGDNKKETDSGKGNSLKINLAGKEDWVQEIVYSATDRAGNKSKAERLTIDVAKFPWFGGGRLMTYPVYILRLDSRQSDLPSGTGFGLAADLSLSKLTGWKQNSYLPGLRFEAQLSTFRKDQNTEESLSEVRAGFAWLLPLRQGSAGALSAAVTAGGARYLGITNAKQVNISAAIAANLIVGYEYYFGKLFAFAHWRLSFAVADTQTLIGHGPCAGLGIIF